MRSLAGLALAVSAASGCSFLFDDDGPYTPLWQRTVASSSDDSVHACAFDDLGRVVVVGKNEALGQIQTAGESLDHSGGEDSFAAGFDDDGQWLWTYRYQSGGETNDRLNDIAVTPNGILVAGHFSDPNGVDFGDGDVELASSFDAVSIQLDADGTYVDHFAQSFPASQSIRGIEVAGPFTFTAGFAENSQQDGPCAGQVNTGQDLFLTATNEDRSCAWRSIETTENTDQALSLAVANSTPLRIYVGGRVNGRPVPNANTYDLYLAAYDESGGRTWRFPMTPRMNAGLAQVNGVVALPTGPCAVGSFRQAPLSFELDGSSSVDPGADDAAFVTCRDLDGGNRWTRTFSGSGRATFAGIAVDGNVVYAAGSFSGQIDFGTGPVTSDDEDFVIVATDGVSGEALSVFTASAPGAERVLGLDANNRELCVVGEFNSELSFSERVDSVGAIDGFVALVRVE